MIGRVRRAGRARRARRAGKVGTMEDRDGWEGWKERDREGSELVPRWAAYVAQTVGVVTARRAVAGRRCWLPGPAVTTSAASPSGCPSSSPRCG